ncbi:MAG: amidase family protein, partial [Actinomycetota bacterium]
AGATLTEARACPRLSAFDPVRILVLMWEALQVHRARGWWPARTDGYTDETRSYLENTERTGLGAEDLAETRARCAALSAELTAAVDEHGILATPTVPCEAPTHEEAAALSPGSSRRPVVMQLTQIPGPVNVAGLAALTVPCGAGAGGLPVGLHLIARDETTLLAAGRAVEAATGWTPFRPPSR